MSKRLFYLIIGPCICAALYLAGCNNPTGSGTNPTPTPPGPTPPTTVSTLEKSVFVGSADGNLTVESNIGYLEYVWVEKVTPPASLVKEQIFMQFNISQVPSSAIIDGAILKVYVTTLDATCNTSVYRVTGTWEPGTINYTIAQTLINSFTEDTRISTPEGFILFNIKTLVQNWVTGEFTNFGIAIYPTNSTGPSTSNRTRMADFDDTLQHYPRIEIYYH